MITLGRGSVACAVTLALLSTMSPARLEARTAARSAQEEVLVRSPTVARWTTSLSRQLGRFMEYPRADYGLAFPEGTTWVDFTCSDDGRPANITVSQRSGSRNIDRAAVRAVERIQSLHPLPGGVDHSQRYRAVLIFAASQGEANRQLRVAMKDPRLQGRGPDRVLALVAPAPVG